MLLVFAILLIIILVVLVRCIVIVPQSNAYVTEWLGVYKDTWGAGLHIRTPFVERISRKVSLKEEAADFPPQPVITRDNVTMMIDTVVFFQVFDAKMYAYGVNRPIQAIENLSATTLRDIIGSMTLGYLGAVTSSTRRSPPASTRPRTAGASRSTASS
jgi:regulator of protease activity HflC (stomatin/prohibitin superfamily)